MQWIVKSFEQLSASELYGILKARVDVFVVEQECAYPELDHKDQASLHLFAMEEGEVVAYARLLPPGVSYPEASIGRVLIVKRLRNTGTGRRLMDESMRLMREKWDVQNIKIQAQDYARAFYASFGFEPVSEVYPEDDIPHVDMRWTNADVQKERM
ncbi:GNAT family N-acetyltransferase [Salisediminibacterium beveridgei]|uniref:GNAT family N-acetyltransferase n=1 Tax=Salisediminibacterium beveridgei TaxID=632773 RepID=UPI000A507619|nr:GNAT family N-acetyltransferase [Salisediminibacterium beveridgei]